MPPKLPRFWRAQPIIIWHIATVTQLPILSHGPLLQIILYATGPVLNYMKLRMSHGKFRVIDPSK